MVTDPIADFLVQLQNAQRAHRERFVVPHSKVKVAIISILRTEGVVADVTEKSVRGKKLLEVLLPSNPKRTLRAEFVRVSKPGRRMYVKAKDIPRPLSGYGLVVLSTPMGILTGKEARRRGVGGEILFTEK
jgi:small subunit ribosomal protein S8